MTRNTMLRLTALVWRGLRCVAAVLAIALLCGCKVEAQALPTATGPGAYVIVGGMYSGFKSDYGQQKISGVSIFADTNFVWRYGLEAEARRMTYSHFGERQSTLLVGPRWSFRAKGVVPYVKVLMGGGRFDFPYGYGYGKYFVVAPGAGVDLRLGQRMRVRLVDFEYQQWPGFTFASLHPYGVSAGISFQILGSTRTKMSR